MRKPFHYIWVDYAKINYHCRVVTPSVPRVYQVYQGILMIR